MHTASPSRRAPDPDGDALDSLRRAVETVFHGKPDVVLHVLTALLARGHVLLADVPGVGKTTLAQSVADALGCSFSRIQFTADLLPSDILGVSIFDEGRQEFRFHRGPIFAHVVLADEINRTPPRTQSALLEAMNEGQVSVDGEVHRLPSPFLVIATRNPLEHHGTFPLPESQVDRFLMRLRVGYPDAESERLLLQETAEEAPRAARVLDPDRVRDLQAAAMAVQVHRDIEDYILAIVAATRQSPELSLGASPRASQALVRAARSRAMLLGRDYATPDDVQEVAEPVLAHRLVPAWSADPAAGNRPGTEEVLAEILARVTPPR
jgi:MoxR-like ATPase